MAWNSATHCWVLTVTVCLALQGNVKPSHTNNQEIHFRAYVSKVEALLGNGIKGWRKSGLD